MKRLEKNLASGGNIGLIVFLLWGSLVLIGLFLSVHSRNIEGNQNALQGRWPNVIILWEKHGYFTHGGLWFSKPLVDDPAQTVISPYTMGFLQAAHLLEKIHIWFADSFNFGLLAFHNQLIPMLSSVLLGFLAMRLTLRLGIRPIHAFVLGLSVQTMYQTFPNNLWFFWEIYPTTMSVFFILLFLIFEEQTYDFKSKEKFSEFLSNLSVFCMVFVEWVGALWFLTTYYLVCRFLLPGKKPIQAGLMKLILPAAFACFVMVGQIMWVKTNYPEVNIFGKSLEARIGLDHSFLQTGELTGTPKKRYEPLLPDWNNLAIAGFLATFFIITFVRKKNIHFIHLKLLATCLGFYALFLILNPKTFILPEAYAVYLAFPLILALFAFLPAWLETFNNHSGIFVLTFSVLAFCWSCIQLRNYSIYYPL